MRLNLTFLTTIALVSFAYAVPVPREATSLQVRSNPLKVTSVSVTYNPAGLVVDQGDSGAAESLMKVAINNAMVPKFTRVDNDDFHFKTTSATKDEDTAKFTLEVEENGKTKKYKGGELKIGTNLCSYLTRLYYIGSMYWNIHLSWMLQYWEEEFKETYLSMYFFCTCVSLLTEVHTFKETVLHVPNLNDYSTTRT
ncbi:hypothetical protein GG344DRAFT_71093 [Lentinula edodes]|nr:hypothetical protein GG344DRAFT_71093 [Lentinula edodes]